MGRDVVPYMPPVVDQTTLPVDFPFHSHLSGHPALDHHFWPAIPLPPMFNHFAALSGTPWGIIGSGGGGGTTTTGGLAHNLTHKPQPLSMPTFQALLSQYVLANGNIVVDNEQEEERSNSGSPDRSNNSPPNNNNNNINNNNNNNTDVRLRLPTPKN